MREADMKCKVNLSRFPSLVLEATAEAISVQATRSRKLAAEYAFCCEFDSSDYRLHAQSLDAKARMTGKNSQQKSLSGQMPAMKLVALHLITASCISGLLPYPFIKIAEDPTLVTAVCTIFCKKASWQ